MIAIPCRSSKGPKGPFFKPRDTHHTLIWCHLALYTSSNVECPPAKPHIPPADKAAAGPQGNSPSPFSPKGLLTGDKNHDSATPSQKVPLRRTIPREHRAHQGNQPRAAAHARRIPTVIQQDFTGISEDGYGFWQYFRTADATLARKLQCLATLPSTPGKTPMESSTSTRAHPERSPK